MSSDSFHAVVFFAAALLAFAVTTSILFMVESIDAPLSVGVVSFLCFGGWALWRARSLQRAVRAGRNKDAEAAFLQVREQLALIDELLSASEQRYHEWQRRGVGELNILRPGGMSALRRVQRLRDALADRAEGLRALTKDAGEQGFLRAAALCGRPLAFENTSSDTIAGGALPELHPERWKDTLDELFAKIEGA
ncbi:MAG: hypothetical protein KDD69_15730 [Bdellovibrionales bacterium]|nr:hypothetical protein [Bdellovibrionales bacterium]